MNEEDDLEMEGALSADLGMDEEEDETPQVAGLTQLSTEQFAPDEGYRRIIKANEEARDFSKQLQEQYLALMDKATKKLLAKPTKLTGRERLDMILETLSKRPTDTSDPRFFERKNIGTFFRDIGEAGTAMSQTERERIEKRDADLRALEEMKLKFLMPMASEREKQTLQELTRAEQQRARAARPGSRAADIQYAEAMGMSLKDYLEYKKNLEKPESDLPSGEAGQIVWAETTLDDPNASPAQKRAAARLLERKTPFDIRKSKMLTDKNSANFLARLKQQNEFTIPIIDEAIRQAEEGGVLATGNLSRWVEGKPWIGQAATDLERTLDAIKSNIGFEKLAELKELSPSGASGLGAVSNAEQALLQSVKGSVARDQRKENLVRNLERIKDFYQKEMFQILERETGMRGITDIDEAIEALQNKDSSGSAPAAQSFGDEKSPRQKALEELNRRRAGGG